MPKASFFLAAWLLASAASADDWRTPTLAVTASASGKFSVRVTPGAGAAASEAEDGYAQAQVFARTADGVEGLTWQGALRNPRAPVDVAISDDGVLITADQWGRAGYDEVLTIYDRRGQVRHHFTLEELLPAARLAEVPTSISSRWWRRAPADWRIEAEGSLYTYVSITLWNEDRLEVQLREGGVSYIEVADVGDDPERLFRRGEDQLRREAYEDAITTLEKATAGDPQHAEAALSLARAYQAVHAYARAIAVLEDASRALPIPSQEDAAARKDDAESGDTAPEENTTLARDRAVRVRTDLARAYRERGRKAEAEKVLRTVHSAAPESWPATRELAGLLLTDGRNPAAGAVLYAHRSQRGAGLDGELAQRESMRASRDVGELYAAHDRLETARDVMRPAFDAADPDPSLGLSLARVLTRLGATEEAREIYDALRTWAVEQGGFETLVETVEAEKAALSTPAVAGADTAATVASSIAALGDAGASQRAAAAAALYDLGAAAAPAVEALNAALDDENDNVSYQAVRALGAIGPAAATAAPRLLTLLDHPSPRLHLAAAAALGDLGEAAVPALTQRFIHGDGHGNGRGALLAKGALAQLGAVAVAAVPALRAFLADSTSSRRLDAAELLATIGGPGSRDATPFLIAAAEGDDTATRIRALTAIGHGRLPTGLPILRTALNDPLPTLRTAAAAALGRFDGLPPDAVGALITALDDPAPRVRGQAATALGSLGVAPREVFDALERAASDPDPKVQRAAEQARDRLDTSALYGG